MQSGLDGGKNPAGLRRRGRSVNGLLSWSPLPPPLIPREVVDSFQVAELCFLPLTHTSSCLQGDPGALHPSSCSRTREKLPTVCTPSHCVTCLDGCMSVQNTLLFQTSFPMQLLVANMPKAIFFPRETVGVMRQRWMTACANILMGTHKPSIPCRNEAERNSAPFLSLSFGRISLF